MRGSNGVFWLVAALAAAFDPGKSLCRAAKGPCTVLATEPAGADLEGHDLAVVRLVLADGDLDGPPPASAPCVPQEVWLVRSKAGKKVDERRILELCNDGYGAAMIGEDRITVGANVLVHTVTGGATWRWSRTTELQLSPLRPLLEHEEGWFADPNHGTRNRGATRWDWGRFEGRVEWTTPLECGGEERISGAYGPIPRVGVPGSDGTAWREAALGKCALHVDATGAGGFLVDGEPGDAEDSGLAVLFGEPTTLWIEVTDDVRVDAADDPLAVDHVEIWIGPARNVWSAACQPDGTGAGAWRIPLAGDQPATWLGPADAGVQAPSVDRVGSRMRVQLAEPPAAISVAFSDSDDGVAPERVIATSALRAGDARTLGGVFEVRPDRATCAVVDGRLEPVVVSGWQPR